MIKKLLLLFLLMLPTMNLLAQQSWKLMTEDDGIKVFSRSVSDSKVKAVKVECELNVSPSELVALLLDVKTATHWVSHTKSCVLLKRISPTELYYYSEVSLPWPLDNRDFVAHVKVSQDPISQIVTVDAPAIPGWVSDKKSIVRINHSVGHWTITPLATRKIHLEYTLHVNPGGGIPAWTVNALAAQGPLESFKKMKEQLASSRYQQAAFGFSFK